MTDTTASTPDPSHLGELRRERLLASRLYVCTDVQRFISRPEAGPVEELDFEALRIFLSEAYAGGVDIIQIRDKQVSAQTELAAAGMFR